MEVQHVDSHNPPSSISSSPQLTILIRGEPLGDTLCKSALQKSNINPRNTSIVQIQALANWETGIQTATWHLNKIYGLAYLLWMTWYRQLRVEGSWGVIAYEMFFKYTE